jgi:SnoaL-like domain
MSTTTDITTIVDGHLSAYAEPDAERRAELIRAVWAQDGELIDPPLTGEGHDGIAAAAEALLQHYPGHRFRRTTGVDGHHDRARYGWELIAPSDEVVLAGTDFAELTEDGRLRRVTGFFGDLDRVVA